MRENDSVTTFRCGVSSTNLHSKDVHTMSRLVATISLRFIVARDDCTAGSVRESPK